MFYYHPFEPPSQLCGVLMSPPDWGKKVDFFCKISMAPSNVHETPYFFDYLLSYIIQ